MGNDTDNDLGKYNCSCVQKEDGCFMDFFTEPSTKDPFNFVTNSSKHMTQSELEENIPGGKYYPNDNMDKSSLKKKFDTKSRSTKITDSFDKSNNNLNNEENEIKEFDKKTDYFQLINQINKTIKELKSKIYYSDAEESILNSTIRKGEIDFRKLGKRANKIIFNDIILCIKKISEIYSEVVLLKDKMYLGIVNQFRKETNKTNLLNYEDREKIISLPNFDDIDEKIRLKLGDKYNNNKFKFHKFDIKGSFPSEILIWNLITQNTQEIADILTNNFYCAIVLLYYSKIEDENEAILYLINKPALF